MLIVKIEAYPNGGHENQSGPAVPIPTGWAVIPENLGTMDTLENFPFGNITVEDQDGIPTVTSWTPLPIPEPENPEPGSAPGASLEQRVDALETETAAISAAIERGLRL